MDIKLELVPVPVTDVDRAKAFYVLKPTWSADHDQPLTSHNIYLRKSMDVAD